MPSPRCLAVRARCAVLARRTGACGPGM